MVRLVIIILLPVIMVVSGCGQPQAPAVGSAGEPFTFGEIEVCEETSQIRFTATVKKNQGWVQHLVYLRGYHWLEDQAAIVSDAMLTELQNSFALLDWQLWDELWQDIVSERAKGVKVYVKQNGIKVSAASLIAVNDDIYIGDLVFLGCPYFDGVALSSISAGECMACPVFPLEQKALQSRFLRQNGETGYYINNRKMFAAGSRVEVIIQLPS